MISKPLQEKLTELFRGIDNVVKPNIPLLVVEKEKDKLKIIKKDLNSGEQTRSNEHMPLCQLTFFSSKSEHYQKNDYILGHKISYSNFLNK